MVIYGKHPVICAIDSNASIEKVLIYENLKEKEKILNMCKAKNINYELVSKFKIEQIVSDDNHQGVCAYLINEPVCKLSENLENFLNSENKILLIIDRIQDPYNLGSIIRSAFVLNVKNIVSTYTQSSKITPSVIKASAGAIFYINFSYSDNLKRVIEILKENKIPVYSLERGGILIEELDVKSEKLAIIVGSEHYGIRKKLIEMSDKIITLRQYNFKVNSYNVSNAVAIALYILTLKFQIK